LAGHTLTLPGLRLDAITQTLADPANRVKLLKFLLYRESPNENGAREYYFYVNNEIPRFGPAPVGGTSQPASAPNASATNRSAVALAQGDGSLVYGRATDGASVLSEPKNVALAPDGRLYVTEGKAGRITAFNPDGTIAAAWGTAGQGDGQFQEPWGIAVAPNADVYVADTWNHRIQRFDANGAFLGAWGHLGDARGQVQSQAGLFYGPRAIAISPQGEVYVTDTGNKRIEVFGLDGAFHRTFGGEGSAPGQFQEPVGIAADPDGTVWVADAWNHRVQHLDAAGAPLGAFPISGAWDNQSITNKPYLALRPEGQIVVTYPDEGKMVVYTREGQQVSTTQTLPGGTAVGVAVGPNGRTYTVDGKNGVVVVR
jgi:sugar lactone lactonase YvrE